MVFFRIATMANINKGMFLIMIPYLVFYRIVIESFVGIELPYRLKAGKRLRLMHGQALVVNGDAIIGANCTLRHSTTIGNVKKENGSIGSPTIGNNVEIGSNTCLIGNIEIGDNVIIGAGSVVVKSIPPNSVVVGNPGRVIKTNNSKIHNE